MYMQVFFQLKSRSDKSWRNSNVLIHSPTLFVEGAIAEKPYEAVVWLKTIAFFSFSCFVFIESWEKIFPCQWKNGDNWSGDGGRH